MAKKRKKSRRFLKFLLFILICMVAFFVSSFLSYNYFSKYGLEQKEGDIIIPEDKQIMFKVPNGASTDQVATLLYEDGYIKNINIFKILSKFNGYDEKYKAGTHIISADLNYDGLMRILTSNPIQKPTQDIRIPEGLTYIETRDYLFDNGYIEDKDHFDWICNNKEFDYEFLKDIGDREYRLEGFLYPDTYKVEIDATDEDLVAIMLEEFDKNFKQEYYERAKELNMSVDEIVTMASMIEMEALYEKDKPLISSVFHNRLNSNYNKLESDVTIQYARVYAGKERTQEVLYIDLEIDSPYNTYKHAGLPPGPICSPRITSIAAALYPASTNYKFFFATDEGLNIYNETYAEHEADLREYGLK